MSSEVSNQPDAPKTIRYGKCEVHGFVDTSHRCAYYDGQETFEYRRVETCNEEWDRVLAALRKLPNYVPLNTVLETIASARKTD